MINKRKVCPRLARKRASNIAQTRVKTNTDIAFLCARSYQNALFSGTPYRAASDSQCRLKLPSLSEVHNRLSRCTDHEYDHDVRYLPPKVERHPRPNSAHSPGDDPSVCECDSKFRYHTSHPEQHSEALTSGRSISSEHVNRQPSSHPGQCSGEKTWHQDPTYVRLSQLCSCLVACSRKSAGAL